MLDKLAYSFGKTPDVASLNDWYMATALALRDRIVARWLKTGQRPDAEPGVQHVLHAKLNDEARRAHDAELRDLVDQHLEPEIYVADQTQLAQFLSPAAR